MRIGELLQTPVCKISVLEESIDPDRMKARKTGTGRVVYFGNDAAEALYHWLMKTRSQEGASLSWAPR